MADKSWTKGAVHLDNKMLDLQRVCNAIVKINLAVQEGEEVFIVADSHTDMRIAYAFANAATDCGAEYTLAIMPARVKKDNRLMTTTAVIAEGAKKADVYIALSKANQASIMDSRIVEQIKQKRFRNCCLTGRDIDNLIMGGALADYESLNQQGIRLKKEWDTHRTFKMKSPAGTYITGELNDADSIIGCGIAREPGSDMAFADGEVSSSPKKGTVNGVIVIDGPIYSFGMPVKPVKMTVKNSRVISVDDGDPAIVAGLRKMFSEVENSDYIAEIAIGLNPMSLMNGDFMEEKKAYGNMHVALGDNTYFGGDVVCGVHIDMVIKGGTMLMDGVDFVRDGKVVILD